MKPSTKFLRVAGKRLKSTQIFLVAATILLTLMTTLFCISILISYEVHSDVSNVEDISYWKDHLPEEQHLWYQNGIEELNLALNLNRDRQNARNVVIFVVNGIETAALAAARFADSTGVPSTMSWEKFPHVGRLKNSCSKVDKCDAYTVGTAFYGGVKTNNGIGGLDATVAFRNCSAVSQTKHHVKSIFRQAQEIGLRTGFVTTNRVTAPTIAALYAHTPDTSWECDATMPLSQISAACQGVAQQLINSDTGSNLNVIMGGGRQALVGNVPITKLDPIDENACNSQDKRNLLRDWQKQKLQRKQHFMALQTFEELKRLNGSAVDYVMGIYANGKLNNAFTTQDTNEQLTNMINKTLQILQRPDSGYILLLETGVSSHSTIAEQQSFLHKLNASFDNDLKLNSSAYTDTLTLIAFHGGNFRETVRNVSQETDAHAKETHNATDDYQNLDGFPTETIIYAKGPKSYLFHGIHEETYMAHVIAYALQMGQFNLQAKDKK